MSRWWCVCAACGLGANLDEPIISTKNCDHLEWTFVKEEEEPNEGLD